MSAKTRRSRSAKSQPAKLSRNRKPEGMPLDVWQRELRRQFGRSQKFHLKNLGDHPVFSEFQVVNPESRSSYRAIIRGVDAGDNFCSCGDFATNSLGTCKHLEFVLAKLDRRHGRLLKEPFAPPFSEIYLQYGSERRVCFRAGADVPHDLQEKARQLFGDDGVLRDEAADALPDLLSAAQEVEHPIRCRDDVHQYLAERRDAAARRETLAREFPRGAKSAAFKSLLKVPLYPYQAEGAIFAARAGRCLIGDEMGLGKTIQALAGAEIMARHFGVERILILCPTSLKHQWQREIEKFTDRPSQVISGLRPQRQAQFREPASIKIMNYDTVHADLDLIRGWSPDLVILDEAQRIKNWSTRVARSVKRIESPYAIVLTGTPLENRLEELISIVQFVDRHRLGPTYRLLHDHQILDPAGKVVGYQNLDQLGKTLEPILIRRRKDIVADQLPERIDQNVFVQMTAEQMRLHDENREIVARVVQKWRRSGFLSEADKQRLMIGLQNMRMACDSSYLLDQTGDHSVKPDEFATLLDEMLETPGQKVVVFSQWRRMHELIERRLQKRGLDYVLFHGGVPGPRRKELVDRFRDDPNCRLFLSTDAGGVGLNLQFASAVVNLDLPWNPAVLEQRIGRVHRLGQKRPVQVVNFVSQGTIEQGMLEVIRFKKSLFAGVLDGGDRDVFLGGSRLTKFMEAVESATEAIPTATVEESEPTSPPPPSRNGDAPTESPWAGLAETGIALLQKFAASQPDAASPAASSPTARPAIITDPTTGQQLLQIPVPSPEAIQSLTTALQGLLRLFP